MAESEFNLTLEYNDPVVIAPGSKAEAQTTQAPSLLQIVNLSSSFVANYYINGGQALTQVGGIPANDPNPRRWNVNFNGAKLVVANTTTKDASIEVTLIST